MSATSAPTAERLTADASLLQCRSCPVRFGGSPTDPRTIAFRDNHEQVNHNPTRTADIVAAAERTWRREARVLAERAEKVAAREARKAAEQAQRQSKQKYRPVKVRAI